MTEAFLSLVAGSTSALVGDRLRFLVGSHGHVYRSDVASATHQWPVLDEGFIETDLQTCSGGGERQRVRAREPILSRQGHSYR